MRNAKRSIVLLLSITMALLGTSIYFLKQESNKLSEPIVVLSIGDSVTEGAMDYLGDNQWLGNYNRSLAEIFTEDGINSVFLGHGSFDSSAPANEGHGGYCISPKKDECVYENSPIELKENSILFHLDKYLKQEREPNLIILQGGINDINVSKNGRDLGSLLENFNTYLQRVSNHYPKAKIIIMPPIFAGDDAIVNARINELVSFQKKLDNERISFLNLDMLNNKKYFIGDYIHPNDKGYDKIADLLYSKLKERGWL